MPKIEIPHRKSDRFRFKKTPELLFAGQVVDERRFYAPPQIHDFREIIYIVEGAGEFRIAGKTYEVRPGDVAVYNAGVPHEERSLSPQPFKLIYCGVSNVHIEGVPQGQLLPAYVEPVIPCEKYAYKVESCLSEMLQECDSQVLGYETLSNNLLMSLITLLYRIVDVKHPFDPLKDKNEITVRTKQFIDKNYTRSITLKEIADTLYVSQHYLSHLFKKELGDSPVNYLITRRIEEAKRLLAGSDAAIHEIASRVGYGNDKYFSMLFKKVTGQSPSAYRDAEKQKRTGR
ncbi:AraC family transcriptional regulator [Paenibacillus macerans]|uniref:AraC family transcriptional regulator n=1 Tax=Paenibacillus macerans TaxID=44252 RepID=UPI000ED8C0A2|nr:AraC family transcriptional regulator [Paenibacillus macerans]GBK62813.1 AraC family transcriptional regulator [Paenibacillus macerans]GBK69126.1 AraC family transcriptional regulator [Paenibacillus macerans]